MDNTLKTDYEVRLATLKKLGGDMTKKYASIYEVDLAILDKTGQGGGGEGGGLTPEQEALLNSIVNKVEQVRLVTDGQAIRYEGSFTPLTFDVIYSLVMDNSKYVYVVMDNNIRFRPSAYDGEAIWFDSSFIEDGTANILRCIINKSNKVSIDQIEVASKSDIPSVPTKVSELENDAHYLTEHQSLDEYAKKSEIPTKTSELENDSNFLTEHQKLKTINGESIVGEGNIVIQGGGGGLTPEQLEALDPELNPENGILMTDEYAALSCTFKSAGFDREIAQYCWDVDGEIYANYNYSLLKYNPVKNIFEKIANTNVSGGGRIWKDFSGRMYFGNHYKWTIDSETGGGYWEYVDLGCDNYSNSGGMDNLIKTENHIYIVNDGDSYIFNEDTQMFESCTIGNTSNLPYYMTTEEGGSFWYEGHYVIKHYSYQVEFDEENMTFKSVNYIPTMDSEGNYTSGRSMYKVGGVYYHLRGDVANKLTEDNVFEKIQINSSVTPVSYDKRGFSTGELIIGVATYAYGGMEETYSILNVTDNDFKSTYWNDINNVGVVTLSGTQTIDGDKWFNSVRAKELFIENVHSSYNKTEIELGKSQIKSDSINVKCDSVKINDKKVATTDLLILNREHIPYGDYMEIIPDFEAPQTGSTYFFEAGGKLFVQGSVGNGYAREVKSGSTDEHYFGIPLYTHKIKTIEDGTFTYYGGHLYKFNDDTQTFTSVMEGPYTDEPLWVADENTLRLGSEYKITKNGDSYSYESDNIDVPMTSEWSSIMCGGNVYVINPNTSEVYEWIESSKSFNKVGDLSTQVQGDGYASMVVSIENELLYVDVYNRVRKINFSREGYLNEDTGMTLDYSGSKLFKVCDGKLFYAFSDEWGYYRVAYIYGINETTVDVPEGEGNYQLVAHRGSDGSLTYSWSIQ